MSAPVGIVLVSHSAELAAGLHLLVQQIGSDAVPVVTAAGTGDGRIGTSYELVRAAVEDADRGGGVLVLADLGSSVLTTRTVLDDHPRADVVIADAPFVEGAVAAVVTAASGADLQTVANSAEEARHVRKL
ncbi:phosphoenolpyruvate--protein phosphotransferase [Streptomyces oryzae]|uniref:phosphoenolpyruvate--glycerone phosphotransferase n=1 Tax=Streptomyces oryzae TaxID=1434886 RepID=A0ABS3X449_9ACTN|nr:dihydroxyacetone kinase phosphoryl donor subunit DhaM [Streptomyces oryzae]MBO8190148.1 phosphoenolpyruvate--protein phosphotransferase [Streptomyces oryzae]